MRSNSKKILNFVFKVTTLFVSTIQNKIPTIFFMQKDLDENSYEKRIENIEKGKSYLKNNGFFRSTSSLFLDIQKFIYKR